MTTELSLKLIAEPVTHFAVKRRGKRWVNPLLQPVSVQYQVAEGSPLPVVGQFQSTASIDGKSPDVTFPVIVTKVPNLNLLGRLAMMKLKLTNLTDHFRENLSCAESTATIEHVTTTGPENSLDAACIQLCGEFPTLFESTLGCLKDFSLDIRFKPEAKPIFKKPRPVPFSILQDLNEAYEAGSKRGVWELTDFNSYGTPVVPIRKSPLPGQAKASIRVCGDYSVTVNSQLEDHRQPIPLPEDLMRKLGRGYLLTARRSWLSALTKGFYCRKDFLSELNPHQGISKKSWNS